MRRLLHHILIRDTGAVEHGLHGWVIVMLVSCSERWLWYNPLYVIQDRRQGGVHVPFHFVV